ncbi:MULTISPECIES: NAD(P)-dependent oxidoreductase [unclassified Mesorhizobium]|uniref:NAD(P)-dependent oxidoreductase n=1 Tax=unclassified Mesorhizobium TaxID=325217 RepID=UPI0024151C08|nr:MULTISPECIES: NAD(P)-dependent oxidoreductase [unclassified Mesorhizobium]MDG4889890.1 NAD(P)-dependent oxidoreductase [Mesorhizobium sp. WSM4887]MDG4904033.1 NAD(P)-dependent oxidoreductase [Mesorhizobium sp. WSM4962]MDG4909060.1 NAD(P)-dependent oxidoreductase [Mesorhizobium sp. WSM4898]MDG4921684.1 NAD(P)-dependent oxidoreductase [Mesorhizobium sp. WSM4989]
MTSQVGVVGLGRMGMAMAERFAETGLTVIGTDVSQATLDRAAEAGIQTAQDSLAVIKQVDVVVLSLPTANDVKLTLDGLPDENLGRELFVIDTTTSDPLVTKELAAKLEPAGIHLLDAPVSGGFFGARAGTLGMMVGGQASHLDRVRDLLSRIAGKIVHMGPIGSGHATKLLNNLLGAANMVVASEIVELGEYLGLAPADLISALNAGTARNSATELNYPKWILSDKFDSGFTMRLMRKDVALADQLLRAKGNLPVLTDVASIWEQSKPSVADDADFNKITQFHPSK